MKRREFVQQSALGALGLSLPKTALVGASETKKLTILHTNDQHSRIEPFEVSGSRNSNKGGFARRASLVEKIRSQEKNVILLDSGDIFQGTPYFNYFGGEVEFKLMSYLKYDASTLGNHDFDNGLQGLNKQLPHAKFPFIISNYDFSNTLLESAFEPYKIFTYDGMKVGIFGLGIELDGLVTKINYQETQYLDPIEISQEMVKTLKNKKCDLIICLSHLGYKYNDEPDRISDVKLAAATSGIDIILGGHTHTFLPEPEIFNNSEGKKVMVNQVGWAGLMLGRIDVEFNPNSGTKNYAYRNLEIDERWA